MKLRLALAAATCLALPLAAPLAAYAQPVTGPYVSLEGGTSFLSPINYTFNSNPADPGKIQTRPSYAGIGAIGYGFGNGLRVEVSGDYMRNTIHELDDSGAGNIRATGGMNTYGAMFNVLYDINAGLPIFPYVGAGGGYQYVKLNSSLNSGGVTVNGTKGSPAFDLIGGVAYPIASVPGLSLTAEYRYMQITSNRRYSYSTAAGTGTNSFAGQSSNSFLVGLRYQLFNAPMMAPAPAPAPAPMAAPAPAPARTYLVFFDWDKSNLTPRATQIIAEAASDSKTTSTTTLSVSGYTDTSGTPTYNQGLSERRAKTVAAQLVTDGVPASEIEIHAFGETHLLVPTGPGVREPQNRRVEIVLN